MRSSGLVYTLTTKINKLFIVALLGLVLPVNSILAADYSVSRTLLTNGDIEAQTLWQAFGNGFSYDTAQKRNGQQSLKVINNTTGQLAGAYQRVELDQSERLPVTLTGYIKGSNIRNGSGGYFGASLYVEIHLQDGSIAYWNSPGNFGTFNWRLAGINIGNLPSVNQPIDYINVVAVMGNATGQAWFDDLTLTEYRTNGPAVTFMMDDGDVTTMDAKAILDTKGFKASAPIPLEHINQSGYLSRNQIRTLVSSGWELMAHGVSHEDLSQMSQAKLVFELSAPQKMLQSIFRTPVKNIAYPYGAYSGLVVDQARRYYRSGRAYELGNNGGGSYTYDIKVRSLENTTTGSEVQGWLDQAKSLKQWVVLVGHRVAESGDDKYYIPKAQFTDVVTVVADSGIPVVTYDQGLDRFGL